MKTHTTLALIAMAALGILGFLTYKTFRHQGNQPVRIGYLPIYVDLPLFVAVEERMFEDAGLDVRLERFASSPEIGEALVAGNLDVGASLAYSVVLGIESRDSGKLRIFIVDSENKQDYLSSLVTLKDSEIRSVSDLKGKRIASFPGPTAVTFGKLALENMGLKPDDYSLVELDIASHLNALETGLVDALITYEPTATQAVLEKNAIKLVPALVESQVIDPWQAGVWVISTDFAAERPRTASRVMQTLYRALDFMRENPERAKYALSKYTSIKPEVAKETPNIPFAKLDEIDLIAFQRHADILHEAGHLSKRINTPPMLAPRSWVYPTTNDR